jgi:hypothetical protein
MGQTQQHERGVVYVATGPRFIAEAVESARTVRACMPGLPIVLFADREAPGGVFDDVLPVVNPQRSFIDKIEPLGRSPFARTLFLDTDTFVVAPCLELFELLDQFDLGVAHEPGRYQYPIRLVPEAFAEFNTGVLLYRNTPEVAHFWRTWLRFYRRDWERNLREGRRPYDQISFTQVLYRSALRFYVLSPEYNFRTVFPHSMAGTVKIVHGRDLKPADLKALNTSAAPRFFCPNPRDWLRALRASRGPLARRLRRKS